MGAHISQARVSHRGLHLTSGRISQEHTSQGRAHLKGGCLQRRVSHRLAPYRRTSYRHVSHKYISLVSLSYGRASHERAPPVDLSRGVHLLSSQSLCPLHLPEPPSSASASTLEPQRSKPYCLSWATMLLSRAQPAEASQGVETCK